MFRNKTEEFDQLEVSDIKLNQVIEQISPSVDSDLQHASLSVDSDLQPASSSVDSDLQHAPSSVDSDIQHASPPKQQTQQNNDNKFIDLNISNE